MWRTTARVAAPIAPATPLILKNRPTRVQCYFCNESIHWGFAYHCSQCNFNLHLKCASIPFTVEAEFHNHPLKLLRKSVSFTCDACGKEDKDKYSYLCTSLTCSLMVHRKCASLPLTVKHIGHKHTLNLIGSSQVNQSDRQICGICVKKVDTDRVYYCSKCNFVAHLDCGTHEGSMEEIKKEDSEVVDESSINDSLAYAVKKIRMGEDKIEIAEEINHFSHQQHDLKLIDELLINNENCDGCMYPIFPPFYTCAQCRFFLHKSCVELPRKKQHPFHSHRLTLLTKVPDYDVFHCNVCGRDSCASFTYHCEKCWFDADVQCSLISEIFTHEGHDHPLFLSRAPYHEKCSCCDGKGNVFKCADCEFTLDLRCATLPHTVRYRFFEQPFKLCYSTKYDSDGEYYCDICEEERDPKHWFYYCADLNFTAHPDCILGINPYKK
ncbi:uncharacterized protein LOC133851331 [Alnus glutinosa]|uniref:uncharacterized protein LOC133851331 n=1 Tax=Alnus glutinosa TaxID=3517 RepID=UPI002D7785CF|nr:uncharacterized protein LOC133851331 [Alnus glutinosa]XP_062143673.1 uncharacterized protein LOC133851331 [Alnus glutinosa]XP_062143675.1 uncharacterized protein LOC133851331 [Alnus glutinosa]XP_062143676.1 uncharacterized protein LOC133851331 [Alnus glutinosa]